MGPKIACHKPPGFVTDSNSFYIFWREIMLCPVCPAAGWVGGWLGGYIGVNPPPTTKGRLISASITATLITITIVALKLLFNISLCEGGWFTLENIVKVGVKTLAMGIVYSVVVNSLLNHFVYTEKKELPPCCQKKK